MSAIYKYRKLLVRKSVYKVTPSVRFRLRDNTYDYWSLFVEVDQSFLNPHFILVSHPSTMQCTYGAGRVRPREMRYTYHWNKFHPDGIKTKTDSIPVK